ncbi:aldo/keto reductase [Chitinophaga arvensicola]|uniref:Predicted oxidoreductase n=1 Tax=Chitinophaga arvensicola TaxID=29529 RepID=A0A1I0S8A0_9BACT|nr:aldo/keto reductase [Chitinophaga arvensicola]SEW52292.1 Predicted oxidoreductase [Chitinophaga arvensicola]
MKYKLFGTHTGLPVSEFALGASAFGERRGYGATREDIPQILAAYADAGGNFIDVADQYQLGEAEEIVGGFIASRRHDFVICTKYTRSSETDPSPANEGNHRKAMRGAVEASLKRLKTDYIDIYMPHYDDGRTPLEEIARGLEDLVKAGKVVYPGLANFPAWKAAAIASTIPLAALQIEYNLAQRTADRELMAMAGYFGLGTMLYSPLAGGLLTGKYRHGNKGRLTLSSPDAYQEDQHTKAIIDLLEVIAAETGDTPGQIALAWTLHKNCFPIIGARSLGHVKESLQALSVDVSPEQLSRLDSISAVAMGYPHDLLKSVQRTY